MVAVGGGEIANTLDKDRKEWIRFLHKKLNVTIATIDSEETKKKKAYKAQVDALTKEYMGKEENVVDKFVKQFESNVYTFDEDDLIISYGRRKGSLNFFYNELLNVHHFSEGTLLAWLTINQKNENSKFCGWKMAELCEMFRLNKEMFVFLQQSIVSFEDFLREKWEDSSFVDNVKKLNSDGDYPPNVIELQNELKGHVASVANTDVSNLYRLLCEMNSAKLADILMNPQQRNDTFGGWIGENNTRISYTKKLISTTCNELQKPQCITFKVDEDELPRSLKDTFLDACESDFRRKEPKNHELRFAFRYNNSGIKDRISTLDVYIKVASAVDGKQCEPSPEFVPGSVVSLEANLAMLTAELKEREAECKRLREENLQYRRELPDPAMSRCKAITHDTPCHMEEASSKIVLDRGNQATITAELEEKKAECEQLKKQVAQLISAVHNLSQESLNNSHERKRQRI